VGGRRGRRRVVLEEMGGVCGVRCGYLRRHAKPPPVGEGVLWVEMHGRDTPGNFRSIAGLLVDPWPTRWVAGVGGAVWVSSIHSPLSLSHGPSIALIGGRARLV